jgi:hypothetical protein
MLIGSTRLNPTSRMAGGLHGRSPIRTWRISSKVPEHGNHSSPGNLQQHPRRPAPELHRILEFVRVPSPFVGVELQTNPFAMSGNPPTGPAHGFHPPNHFISEYREPGRINLNTVVSERVWQGLWNSPALGLPRNDPDNNDPDNPDQSNPLRIQFGVDVASGFDRYVRRESAGSSRVEIASLWQRWIQSRRGYGSTDNLLEMNPLWPTRFANPLRSWMGAYLFPMNTFQDVVPREVDATLLREHPLDISWQNFDPIRVSPGNPDPTRPRRPLFETESVAVPSATDPRNHRAGLYPGAIPTATHSSDIAT